MKHRTNRHLVLCAALCSAVAFTATSFAQSESGSKGEHSDASAAEHAKRAQVAYDLQDWPTAAREYEAAYKAEQKSDYLWGLAQTHRLNGKYADAIRTYKAFQRAGVSANQANAAEMMVTKCEAELAKEEAKQAQAARAERQESPAPAAAPKISAAPEQDSAESSGGLPIGWFITGAVITVGLGATATWSGLDTRAKATDYEEKPTREGYLDGKDLEKRTNFLLGATAVAAVGTTVIAIFTDWSGSPKKGAEGALRVQPAVARDAGALFLTGAF